jgi:hypothetical protein
LKEWLLGFILIGVVFFLYWNSEEVRDKRIWNDFKEQLNTENVKRISFHGKENHKFSEEEKVKVIDLLKLAKFQLAEYEQNQIGKGPRPEGILNLEMEGRIEHIGYWYENTFEVAPKKNYKDSKASFIVVSEELAKLLNGLK